MSEQQCREHLLCWMFRQAQNSWKMTPEDVSKTFKKYDLYDYILKAYDWMHYGSYDAAFIEMNDYLKRQRLKANAYRQTMPQG